MAIGAIAYLDYVSNTIVPRAEVVPILLELGAHPRDFDLRPLFAGGAFYGETIGYECDKCGAPLGSKDPDECRYVATATCSDCREP